MKHLNLILLSIAMLALPSALVRAQSVTVTGPSTVEVGIPGTYTATFNNGGTSAVIESFEWSVPFIGTGIGGPSGILGSINGQFINPLTITTNNNTLSVPVIWGDFFTPFFDQVRVTAHFKEDGKSSTVVNDKNVTVKNICPPTISGPTAVQQCCTTPLTFTASACDANLFTWSITSGGTITSGNGTATITVLPSVSSGFTLTCVARRSTGLVAYSRTSTTTITRFQPVTPAIVGASFFCSGSSNNVSVGSICGMTGVNWIVPPSLVIVSGQGTANIVVTPATGVPGGTTGTLTAQAVVDGGCTATVSQHNFTIYGAETPPTPQGYITLVLDSGDACNDPVYRVVWHPNTPYLNGYTTVSPGIVLGGTHPHGGGPHGGGGTNQRIKITVCNVNRCSGLSSCIEFWIDRPYPCEEGYIAPHGGSGGTTAPIVTEERNSQSIDLGEISIYPNPTTSGIFYLACPAGICGQAALFDCRGKLLVTKPIDVTDHGTTFVESPLEKGVYILQLTVSNKTVTKKIVVQ